MGHSITDVDSVSYTHLDVYKRQTFLIEGIGAVLLAIRFIPDFGILRGIYFSVFHSISAFCNAELCIRDRPEV